MNAIISLPLCSRK
uniref:Uncharacterized protein n=1 Tax=Rhizophora mucronata TaxID=61149 RepID=A0A2P2NKB6_RHIMU